VAIGNYHDSGNTHMLRALLGMLAAFFDRLGRYEPAATIAGFAVTSPVAALPPMAEFRTAIAHLRNVLGEATYESLARTGEAMTTAFGEYVWRSKFWKNIGLPPPRSTNCAAGDVLLLKLPIGWHLPFRRYGLVLRTPAR
jgi:hypothetical protein